MGDARGREGGTGEGAGCGVATEEGGTGEGRGGRTVRSAGCGVVTGRGVRARGRATGEGERAMGHAAPPPGAAPPAPPTRVALGDGARAAAPRPPCAAACGFAAPPPAAPRSSSSGALRGHDAHARGSEVSVTGRGSQRAGAPGERACNVSGCARVARVWSASGARVVRFAASPHRRRRRHHHRSNNHRRHHHRPLPPPPLPPPPPTPPQLLTDSALWHQRGRLLVWIGRRGRRSRLGVWRRVRHGRLRGREGRGHDRLCSREADTRA
eukprot:7378696-Prymnesium_polylepis.1